MRRRALRAGLAAASLMGAAGTLFAQTPAGLAPSISTADVKAPIYFRSDALEYREAEQVIVATGNVRVQQTSYTFQSDHALFDMPNKRLEAWGRVRFSDVQGNNLASQILKYDAVDGSAQLLNAEGEFGPWLFGAQRAERDQYGNFLLEKARLSTCEKDFSKYHLYGHRIRILPGRRLTVHHAIFRIGPVPVLYLPYYYYSLGEKHLAFQFFPGQNQSEGLFVRTVWGYPITDETYIRAYLDGLTRRGFGHGGEFNYYFSDRAKGSVYGYRIEDNLIRKHRWNARFFHWQRLTPFWIVQSNVNQLSDDQFPNDFFREDFDRVVRDFRSNLAATYQRGSIFFRAYGERLDVWDAAQEKFLAGDAAAPKVEVNQVQTPLFWGIQKIAYASLMNRFAGGNPRAPNLRREYRRESDAFFTLLRDLRLTRRTTLVPTITLRNFWTDKPQGSEQAERAVQRAEFQAKLRQDLFRVMDLDLIYLINQRFQENTGEDQGRELHQLSLLSLYRPNRAVSFRFTAAHNLPRKTGEALTFLDANDYAPLTGELNLTPRSGIEIFFREEYVLSDPNTGSAHPLTTSSELLLGRRAFGEDFYMIGTSYNSFRDAALQLYQSARYSPFPWLQLEGTLRNFFFYRNGNMFNIRAAEFFEEEAKIKTQWRCWDLGFTFRERKGVYEFVFNIELALERENREKATRKTREVEFYPWRDR